MKWNLEFEEEGVTERNLDHYGNIPIAKILSKLPLNIKPKNARMRAKYCRYGSLGPIIDISPEEEDIKVSFKKSIFGTPKYLTINPDGSLWFLYRHGFRQYEIDVHLKPNGNGKPKEESPEKAA